MIGKRPSNPLRAVLGGVAAAAMIAYPVLVWLGLSSTSPRTVALVLVAIVAPAAFARLRRSDRAHVRGLAFLPLVTLAALSITVALDRAAAMLFVPVAISAVLLLAFGATLRRGAMPMIERFARLQQPDLTAAQCAWCRTWTLIWCLFFVANGITALTLGLWAPLSWWALYCGLIAYGAIGTLVAVEWLLRRRRFPELRAGRGGA